MQGKITFPLKGVQMQSRFIANLQRVEFPERFCWGILKKSPYMGEVWIFSGATHLVHIKKCKNFK